MTRYFLGILVLLMVITLTYNGGILSANDTPGDKEYYGYKEQAAHYENEGNYDKAIEYYKKSLNVDRSEIPSYYVLLDIGRVYHKQGKFQLSTDTLSEYLRYIETELKVENSEILPPSNYHGYGYTEKGLKELLINKAEAESLIAINKSKLKTH